MKKWIEKARKEIKENPEEVIKISVSFVLAVVFCNIIAGITVSLLKFALAFALFYALATVIFSEKGVGNG